ncbi:hypothetical protein EB796_004227 [Bugula neritina]|uniref:Uncharacterized protein n=1 Tax=Bugula neritina TaxID=10212 RepID=A0A7J7KHV0_BUGNE|nr:hypothetical protein EB796_004227 [Bugula neritina]
MFHCTCDICDICYIFLDGNNHDTEIGLLDSQSMDQPIQLALLAAGCQPWNSQVTAASGKDLLTVQLQQYIFLSNLPL